MAGGRSSTRVSPLDRRDGEVGVAFGDGVVARVVADQRRGLVHVTDPG